MAFVEYAAEDFFVKQVTDPKEYFVYFKELLCRITEEDSLRIDKGHQESAKEKTAHQDPMCSTIESSSFVCRRIWHLE